MAVSIQFGRSHNKPREGSAELLAFAAQARTAAKLRGTVSILIESDEAIQALNRSFRGIDKATDVLSFPAAPQVKALHAGDIAVSAEIAAQNAKRYGHSLADEIKILILHGMLHLAGYDHETDRGRMEKLERECRQRFGLPMALIDRTAGNDTGLTKKRDRKKLTKIKAAGGKPIKAGGKKRVSR